MGEEQMKKEESLIEVKDNVFKKILNSIKTFFLNAFKKEKNEASNINSGNTTVIKENQANKGEKENFENNRTTGFHQSCEGKYQTEFPLRNNNDYLSLESLVSKIVNISRENKNSTTIKNVTENEKKKRSSKNGYLAPPICYI